MRARSFAWLAAAAAATLASTASAAAWPDMPNTPRPRAAATTGCDPSKWKPPVDGAYATNGSVDPSKLNVHLIAHSHDDPGWLVGVDQYYMERVQYILDTVVKELLENPDRQFMFVEQSFFQRWWREQSHKTQAVVKELVRQGRLDLSVNGGWCMHDEATPHYTAMVDQTAYGHQLLLDEFNVTARIGWQIDPFGHSATQGSLLSAGVGFDALYFARIDYQDYDNRKANKELEFVWRPSPSRGKHSQVFTGEIIDHYGPPREFNYGYLDVQVQDDAELHDYNVCQVVDDFVKMALDRGASTKGNHIFIPMGDDFQYNNARMWFKNMDKLVHYVNQDARVSVLYSNLSYYTDLKLAEDLTWSVKTDDFFPYGSAKHAYWSGFFTSRPALKRFARVSNQLLQQLRQLDAIYQSHHSAALDKLKRAVGLVQHHDGLSGTEKQNAADDYALRLNDGVLDATRELNDVLFVIGEKEKYELCLLANTSVCAVSTENEEFEVLVHSALPRKSVHTISLPLKHKHAEIKVLSGSAQVRRQEVFDALPVHPRQEAAPHSLVFSTELEALADARFLVSTKSAASATARKQQSKAVEEDVLTLENELVRAKVDRATGSLVSVLNKASNVELPVRSHVGYYQSFADPRDQRSGAYIFRPDSKTVHPVARTAADVALVARGGASRAAFRLSDWVTLEYRVNDGDEFVEVEWTVGPIPIADGVGKEVVVRLDTQQRVASAATLFTDANGLEFVPRVRNHRDSWNLTLHDDQEFVAANYFPITTGAYIRDSAAQLSVATDRAQGAASLADGQLEVMVHRRLLADDGKGVGEPLNETESFFDTAARQQATRGLVVRGSLFVGVDSAAEGVRGLRRKMERAFFAPLVALRKPVPVDGSVEGASAGTSTKTGTSGGTKAGTKSGTNSGGKLPWLTAREFPPNVGLAALQELSKECVMARLAHLFAVEEHAALSQPARVDLGALFAARGAALQSVTELELTGVAPLASRAREPLGPKWKTLEPPGARDVSAPSRPLEGSSVTLQAMEVRSFRLCFAKSDDADGVDGDADGGDEVDDGEKRAVGAGAAAAAAKSANDALRDQRADALLRSAERIEAVEDVVALE